MERHVSLLGILASLWGALSAIIGVAMLLLSAGALVELLAPLEASVSLAAGLAAVGFALFGVFALVFGAAHIWAGALLGAYALWVLLTNDAHRLFEPGPQESGTPA